MAHDKTRLTGLSHFYSRFKSMNKTGFSYKKKQYRWLLFAAAAVILIAAVFYSLYRSAGLFIIRSESLREQASVDELWHQGQYAEIVEIAERILLALPTDRDALLYAGYARFYLAISRISAEDRNNDLDLSICHLRRLKARGGTPNPERVDYVLGKAYLLKGPFWADLAVSYIQSSLDNGYLADDSYEFIGRAYSSLGELETALLWYEKAAENAPTDRLYITLGEDAFRLARYDDAVSYYRKAIDDTRDESLRKRGLSQLGQLYYDVGNYGMARDVLETLANLEPNSVDVHFLLGETYSALGEKTLARSSWFRVTAIDPRHNGALHRLYD